MDDNMDNDDHDLTELIITHVDNNQCAADVSKDKTDILLQAALANNAEELANALSRSDEQTFKKKHSEYDFKKILTIASELPKISENVFQIIFEHVVKNFRDVPLTEECWYYWEPIHFAAYNIDLGKLKIILKNNGESRINALTVFSENALHVLLEYGKRIEWFHAQLSNGLGSRLCHVVPHEEEQLVECAKELINAGIDVNHINIWNESPLIIAIRYRLINVIEFLLKRRDIDLDTSKDPFTGRSARDLLRENEICVDLLTPTSSLIGSPTETLFNYLKSGNEELFLRYNNENITEYSNDLDGNESITSGTMLQLCLIKGYVEYETHGSTTHDNDKDIMKTCMLKMFCQKGFLRSVEHLLNNGAEITTKNRIFNNQNVFQTAAKFGYYPFLAVLLQHKSNQIGQYDILDALKNTGEKSSFCESYHLRHVLYLLISKLEMFYDSAKQEVIDYDNRAVLNDILDKYLEYNEYDENICQVLRLGASLVRKPKDFSRLDQISYHTLSFHLDECIDASNTVCYNSVVLDQDLKYSETDTLHYLTQNRENMKLLNHPALIYLIHEKWLKTRKFFYCNIAFYTMFLISLYVYMVSLHMGNVNQGVFYLFVVFLTIHAFKELVQLIYYRIRYFSDFSNYLDTAIISSCYITLFLKNEMAMVIAILLSTLIFLLMLGQLPKFTKYMIIFSSTKYFFEYAMFYFIQFFSFALCFFILLPPVVQDDTVQLVGKNCTDKPVDENTTDKPVTEIFVKLFDTLFFFIGQYDGPVAQPEDYPVFQRIIVSTFIFCMTIMLNNLLVGLIVTDMEIIQRDTKLLRQVKMVKYIVKIETFLRRINQFYCCKLLKFIFGETNVFEGNKFKKMSSMDIFDEEDKTWLKKIHENRKPKENVLEKLYEHIVNEVYYSDHRNLKGNQDILIKLARLEKLLTKISA